jgi:hypothetical protein
MIRLPDDSEFPAGSADAAHGLSDLLGRQVTTRAAKATETIQHEFPTAITEGEGEPFLWEPGTEAFFDSATLHLLTTGTLSEFQKLQPDSIFHRARFRPNLLVRTDEIGFIENEWVGRDVTLGSLRCHVVDQTQRCVMVTRAQGDLPRDREVIRTIFDYNDGNAGVALHMRKSGMLRCGSEVRILA